jgi:hypothetical protein
MAKWWMSVAILACGLGQAAPARAQFLPMGQPCPPMQEPTPISCPIPPVPAPGVPPEVNGATYNLDRTSAFGTDEQYDCGACQSFSEGCALYFGFGAIALDREQLGQRTVATINAPPRAFPTLQIPVLDANSLSERMDFGVTATLGYRFERQAIELTGFYIPHTTRDNGLRDPASLNLPFFNFPASFGGTTALTGTDGVTVSFEHTLGSLEFNYRVEPIIGSGFELLAGVRYVDLQERFTIFNNATGFSVPFSPPSSLTTYSARTQNRMPLGQVGLDWEHPLLRWVGFGLTAKGAWGVDYLTSDVALERGDGVGQFGHRTRTKFASVYQASVYVDWFLWDRCRVRTGYNALFLVGVAEAVDQVNFDLSQPTGNHGDNGTVFYHGPMIELHLLF